jgi:hypothetical protein
VPRDVIPPDAVLIEIPGNPPIQLGARRTAAGALQTPVRPDMEYQILDPALKSSIQRIDPGSTLRVVNPAPPPIGLCPFHIPPTTPIQLGYLLFQTPPLFLLTSVPLTTNLAIENPAEHQRGIQGAAPVGTAGNLKSRVRQLRASFHSDS